MSLVVVDLGASNTASMVFALERLGARPRVTADHAAIAEAERLILPGVGSAAFVMERLRARGLEPVLRGFPRPLLGVCLGQQLLHEASAEGNTPCLGLLPGRVEPLRGRRRSAGAAYGLEPAAWTWRRIRLLDGVAEGAHVYFVHSFAAAVSGGDDRAHRIWRRVLRGRSERQCDGHAIPSRTIEHRRRAYPRQFSRAAMLILPAIDLRGGRVVRLLHGRFDAETHYGDDPLAQAHTFVSARGRSGSTRSIWTARRTARCGKLRRSARSPGSQRCRRAAACARAPTWTRCLTAGVARVVVGSVAVADPARYAAGPMSSGRTS